MTDQHRSPSARPPLTRRGFLGANAAALAAAAGAGSLPAASADPERAAVAELEYLTPEEKFRDVGRGNPPPHKHPAEKRRAVGLDRDTWQLEVIADPATDAKVEQPLTKERGTALTFQALMELAEKHAVSFIHIMTCLNVGEPLGVGLWEGVPLRVVVWKAKPVENIRRVFYYGYHNDDPEQLFQSSLPIGRVLEDPPGTPPVILCYKLNGAWLTPARGGPVRMVVPDGYGFKSIKWLNRVVLSNIPHANDTYASQNNDVDSSLKTFARFSSYPEKVRAGALIAVAGIAQVGISGLSRVQVWLRRADAPLPGGDPSFPEGEWKDATILPPPDRWGGGLPDGRLPGTPLGFDPATGKPREWPLRFAAAQWAIRLTAPAAGEYELRCRTTDQAGAIQPMPRPFPKGGRNAIHCVKLTVEA